MIVGRLRPFLCVTPPSTVVMPVGPGPKKDPVVKKLLSVLNGWKVAGGAVGRAGEESEIKCKYSLDLN